MLQFCDILGSWRLGLSLDRAQLAAGCSVSGQTFGFWENGAVQPSWRGLKALVERFGFDLNALRTVEQRMVHNFNADSDVEHFMSVLSELGITYLDNDLLALVKRIRVAAEIFPQSYVSFLTRSSKHSQRQKLMKSVSSSLILTDMLLMSKLEAGLLTVGARLKLLRAICGMSQSRFAEFMEYSVPSYVNWESDRFDPPLSMLAPLCNSTIDLNWLAGKSEALSILDRDVHGWRFEAYRGERAHRSDPTVVRDPFLLSSFSGPGHIARELSKLRIRLEDNIQQFADRLGVSVAVVARVEDGTLPVSSRLLESCSSSCTIDLTDWFCGLSQKCGNIAKDGKHEECFGSGRMVARDCLYTSADEIAGKQDAPSLGGRLKLVRLSLGLSQRDFGKLMGMTQGHISQFESSGYCRDVERLLGLSDLAIDFNWLITGSKQRSSRASAVDVIQKRQVV